jgi:CHAD domain-containing protein
MAPSRRDDLAGEVFSDVVADHATRVLELVPVALADEPDGVHRLRAAVRRLRTVLAVYRPVFDRTASACLRTQLAELGAILGRVRDLEVLRDGVESVGRASRTPLDARQRLVADLTSRHDSAHRELVAWCTDEPMRNLTADLVGWVASPPVTDVSARPARKVARKRLRRAVCRAVRAADDVDLAQLAVVTSDVAAPPSLAAQEGKGRREERPGERSDGAGELDAYALFSDAHRLRKAGRRVAHAAKAVSRKPTKVLGSATRELAAAGKQVQSTLGDHRDSVLLSRWVLEFAEARARAGDDRRPYDRLARAAQREARTSLAEVEHAVSRLRAAAE